MSPCIVESLNLLFSGEPYSLVRKGRYVHNFVGYTFTQCDTVSQYRLISRGFDWYVSSDSNMLSEVRLDDFLSKFKMSVKDKENLRKGLSMLVGDGRKDVFITIQFYKLYRKVNYRVFSVTF